MIVVRGHLGLGDCIHQRAFIRDLMKIDEVVLETFYSAMYRDLRADGLKLKLINGHPPRMRELEKFVGDSVNVPYTAARHKLRYNARMVHQHGSILGAQYACVGLRMTDRPDFSMPVPRAWRTMARERVEINYLTNIKKPLMVYRPTVLNHLFHCPQRLPDVDSYRTLFESIRDQYHVVSVANLGDYGEHVVGPVIKADTEFHHGELCFEEMAGLYAEADLAFTCAGYAPVLAQAVGTPTVVVYGGHEGYKTTNIVGAHLAPTLAIEATNQCECHGGHYTRGPGGALVKPVHDHECDKTIDMPRALERLRSFVEERVHADA